MKTKTFISTLLLALFAFIGGGSFDEDGSISAWVWFVLAGFVILFLLVGVHANAKDEEEREERRKRWAAVAAEKKAQEEKYEKEKQEQIASVGVADKTIILKENDINSEINVYESKRIVNIMGKDYDFKDILSCTFSDSPRTIKGKIIAETKSKNGSVIGRSIVGDVVAGPAGAIIGGTTAKKNTVYHQEDDHVVHDYTVIININSISTPIVRIPTKENGKLTNEIVGLMNVIISRRQ